MDQPGMCFMSGSNSVLSHFNGGGNQATLLIRELRFAWGFHFVHLEELTRMDPGSAAESNQSILFSLSSSY
jgi:hypothetical protein